MIVDEKISFVDSEQILRFGRVIQSEGWPSCDAVVAVPKCRCVYRFEMLMDLRPLDNFSQSGRDQVVVNFDSMVLTIVA